MNKQKLKRSIQKKKKNNKIVILLVFTLLIILFLIGTSYLCYHLYHNYKNYKDYTHILEKIIVDDSQITEKKTERMLQIEELQKQNKEIIGWLEISGTKINYPVTQGIDNDFYLSHNYMKEKSTAGSLFLDKDYDLVNGSTNYLIYGHRTKQGLMFEDLIKYAKEEFYKEHKTIRFTTTTEDCEYEILAVFYSRVYYQSEQNVFRYYYFVNAKNEKEYQDFIENAKKSSIYETGVTATYGEQLLTLSTCEYSQKNGRFVVVAKKIIAPSE